ncbi:AraC family transcriptional regulator [Gluconobacter wancherniae]|uniref:AraC family transcriptional regulator n=2 Tax=Gluconobacter wancherniae TaxID=1307955 RepID=A0A511AZV6_9PROT|nr:AraC family transcriptional regulator [Gluconobacter wancherniae]GBR62758.1 AraC family transcriptional regulator [Gluconobacter wancherniae NBRC 103581]GEK93734.1 AraC family transcriptional regulator [Gluconobacter wancherniae NBRC 103581]
MDQIALSSDLMSELLLGMRLRGIQYRRIHTGASFGFAFRAKPGCAYFHFLATGTANLLTEDGVLQPLSAGNAVFLPHGNAHQIISSPDAPVQDIDHYNVVSLSETVCAVTASSSSAPHAIFFSGCMEFDLGGLQGLVPLMPELMMIDATSQRYLELMPILTAMEHEACTGRVGDAGILARLADVVMAVIVRGWVECGCSNSSAFVTALREPKLSRAILALHRQPGRNWTVAELAAESGLSRSVFAKRFQETIGIAPLHYAGELRMRIAHTWLSYDRMPIERVAERLGYTSQAAFSRAYKRITGTPPGYSRRENK